MNGEPINSQSKMEETKNNNTKGYLPQWLQHLFQKYIGGHDGGLPENKLEFLEDLRKLFPRDKDGLLEPNKVLDELSESEGETDETAIYLDADCRDMSLFVNVVRDFLNTRTSTLTGPVQRTFPKKIGSNYYSEFRRYLKDQGFMEKMVDVMYKMFLLHPSIPEDPITYIRDNYSVTKEEELALVKRWLKLKAEVDSLRKKNSELKAQISEVFSKKTPIGRRRGGRPSTAFRGESASELVRRKSSVRSFRRSSRSPDARKKKPHTPRYSMAEERRSIKSIKRMESWMNIHPVVKPIYDWNYNLGEEYLAQDSKVPFDAANYDLLVKWGRKKLPDELIPEDGASVRHGQEENITSSSSDYSVESIPPIENE